MLSQQITRPGTRESRADVLHEMVRALLERSGAATTEEIARQVGMTREALRKRLQGMRDLGDVREAGQRKRNRRGIQVQTWEIGAAPDVEAADIVSQRVVAAAQMGCFRRDPLVEALFGAARHDHQPAFV